MDQESQNTGNHEVQTSPSQPVAQSNKRGLKKILAVIVIFLLIAAATYATYYFYNTQNAKQRDSQRKTDIQKVADALEKYKEKTKEGKYYPSAVTENTLVKNGFIDEIPRDPKDKSQYYYLTSPVNCDINCTGYTLSACLENKTDPEAKDPLGGCQSKSYVILK